MEVNMARRDPELRSSKGFAYILLMSAGLSWPLMALCVLQLHST